MTTVIRRVRLSFGRLAQLTASVLLAVGMFALGTGGASAVTADVECPGAAAVTERDFVLNTTVGGASCHSWGQGNPGADSFAGYVLLDKSDDTSSGLLNGALTLTPPTSGLTGSYSIVAAGYTNFLLMLKSANSVTPAWAAFTLTADGLSGIWKLVGEPNQLSHGSLYGVAATVPVPAGIALGASALGLLGYMGWRRKKTVAA